MTDTSLQPFGPLVVDGCKVYYDVIINSKADLMPKMYSMFDDPPVYQEYVFTGRVDHTLVFRAITDCVGDTRLEEAIKQFMAAHNFVWTQTDATYSSDTIELTMEFTRTSVQRHTDNDERAVTSGDNE